jgi:hypothetical protein
MRKICDLEGEIVRFSGFVETWQQKKNTNNVLFSQVSIFSYNSDTPYKEDHLWIKARDELVDYLKLHGRLTKMEGLAKVIKYSRKDGTTDFTLESLRHKSLEDYYTRHSKVEEIYQRAKSQYKKVACIEVFCVLYKSILDDFENKVLLFPSFLSPKDLHTRVSNSLEKYLTDYKSIFPKYMEKGHPKAIKYRKEIKDYLTGKQSSQKRGFKNDI